jgi:hypothetical protein
LSIQETACFTSAIQVGCLTLLIKHDDERSCCLDYRISCVRNLVAGIDAEDAENG